MCEFVPANDLGFACLCAVREGVVFSAAASAQRPAELQDLFEDDGANWGQLALTAFKVSDRRRGLCVSIFLAAVPPPPL